MHPEPRSVLLIGNFLSASIGTHGVTEELRLRLADRGWKVIWASQHLNRVARLVDMLTTAYRHRRLYNSANIDVFSGPSFIWAELSCRLLLYLGKTVNLTLWGGGLPEFARENPRRVRHLLSAATSVTTPSRYLQEYFAGIRPDIRWLQNGIDISSYHTRQRDYHRPRLVWLRAFHHIYNPPMAVETLAILRDAGVDASLTMIGPDKGDGTYEDALELAKSRGVLDVVNFTGSVPKDSVPGWLDQGEIFLNTTRFESFGVAVLEAAACGLPIVTTDVGELSYLWEHEVDALLIPPDDPQAMANAVHRIITEPGLAEKLSHNARQKAEKFDWSVVLPQWEEILMGKLINPDKQHE